MSNFLNFDSVEFSSVSLKFNQKKTREIIEVINEEKLYSCDFDENAKQALIWFFVEECSFGIDTISQVLDVMKSYEIKELTALHKAALALRDMSNNLRVSTFTELLNISPDIKLVQQNDYV